MSAQPKGRPGWPELAFSTASMARDRIALANSFCWAVFVIGRTALLQGWKNGEKRRCQPHPQAGLTLIRFGLSVNVVRANRGPRGEELRGLPCVLNAGQCCIAVRADAG